MNMSFADATATILGKAGEPLHYKEITRRAVEQELIQTDGKTPEATLNAILAVDIKQRGKNSRFVRIRPGVFALRDWNLPERAGLPETDENRRVRIPHFPSYSEVRLVLPIWDGRQRSQITGLRSTISSLWGSPQEPLDWTDPDTWIPQRLTGNDQEIALAVWQGTKGVVNPRHVYGHWSLASTYGLLAEDTTGQMRLTERGTDFIGHPLGESENFIDEQEGLLKLLSIVGEKGTGRRGDFIPEWNDYLKRYSRFRSDSTIKDTLWRRLYNLTDRGLLSKTGTTYNITELAWPILARQGEPMTPRV